MTTKVKVTFRVVTDADGVATMAALAQPSFAASAIASSAGKHPKILLSNHAQNETIACVLLFLAQFSRYWEWTENPGDMPCDRRMAWCVYPRIPILGIGIFQIVVSFLAWCVNNNQGQRLIHHRARSCTQWPCCARTVFGTYTVHSTRESVESLTVVGTR